MRGVTVALLIALSAGSASGSGSYLQYDAVLEGDGIVPGLPSAFALFLRFYVSDDEYAAEVVHFEPRWNLNNFGWYPIGLAFHSDGKRFKAYNFVRDAESEVQKPVGARAPMRASTYPPSELAYAEAGLLAALNIFDETLRGQPPEGSPVSIERRDGRIHSVAWRLEEEVVAAGEDDSDAARYVRSEYHYDDSDQLDRIVTSLPPRLVPVSGTITAETPEGTFERQPRAVYMDGGRISTVSLKDVAVSGKTIRLPVGIETHHAETGALMRFLRHENYRLRTLTEGEEAPWETWPLARFMPEEDEWYALLRQRSESGERSAFDEELGAFVTPLDALESQYSSLPKRLRAFYRAYHSAALLDDAVYLREGFEWYGRQLKSTASPRLQLQAGMDCIRLLHRLNRAAAADHAIDHWRAAVLAAADDGAGGLLETFAETGPSYFAFQLFDVDHAPELTPGRALQFHYWRCQALKRRGAESTRANADAMGYAPGWWAELNRDEWADLVHLAFFRAEELFSAIDEPTIAERRMMHRIETMHGEVMEGRGFPTP